MDSIEILVQEHENILRMLSILHRASLGILEGGPVEVDDFKKMVEFVRKYADKTHHGKEEEFLFKMMAEELGDMGRNLVRQGMLVEHDMGRLYVGNLDAGLDAYAEEASAEAKLAILVAAGSYEHLLRRHIQKENDVIFPFGRKRLSPDSLQQLELLTQGFEEDAAHREERMLQLEILADLERKYAV